MVHISFWILLLVNAEGVNILSWSVRTTKKKKQKL